MLRLIWILSIYVRSFMRRFMPTNIALVALRTRRGLKWGVPAMLLAVGYIWVARILGTQRDLTTSIDVEPLHRELAVDDRDDNPPRYRADAAVNDEQ
ncbi:hypothetical protein [Rathayibacter sp. AY1E3]|uniref:hypothetical protein n=1 Tax=Rathayibacter sp. AY1E3 TaxID=2080551 RepID=UPI0021579212|nr:hypothetical protein [Rathayibacter sp. AY1E3]